MKLILKFFKIPYSFRFTNAGILYLISIIGLTFAAFNTGNNLLYLILAMFLSGFIISGILSHITLEGIRIERIMPSHIYADKEFTETIRVKNDKKFFSSYSIYISYEDKKVYIPKLFRLQTLDYNISNMYHMRGLYRTKDFYCITTYPFSLVEKKEKIDYKNEFIVYPKIVNIEWLINKLLNPFIFQKKEDVEEFYSFKKYEVGDRARDISWIRTAKDDKLMSKKYKTGEDNKFCIFINVNTKNSDKIEEGISISASLVKYLIDKDFYIKLVTENEIIPYGNNITHLYRVLKFLAVYQPVDRNSKKVDDENIIQVDISDDNVNVNFVNRR